MYNDHMDDNHQVPGSQPISPEDEEAAKKYQEILSKYAADLTTNTLEETPPTPDIPAPPPAAPPEPEPELEIPENTQLTEIPTENPVIITPVEPPPAAIAIPTPPPELTEPAPVALTETPAPEPPLNPVLPPPSPLPPPVTPVSTPRPTLPSPPVTPPVISQSYPSQPGIFKYLFYLSLVVFLCVSGGLVWTMVKLKNLQSARTIANSTTITPTVSAPTPTASAPGCDLNDNHYGVGQSFPAADNCNTCTCNSSLTIDCTQNECSATASAIPASWKTYTSTQYGLSFKYPADLTVKEDTDTLHLLTNDQINNPGGDNLNGFYFPKQTTIKTYIQNLKSTTLTPNTQITQTTVAFGKNKFTKIAYTDALAAREEYLLVNKNKVIVYSGNTQVLSTLNFSVASPTPSSAPTSTPTP